MSHLDELDEFEAELELALKKEYSAVFSLFRYCVLTQDATYLCNRLDLQYVPQQSYPFFQLKMEDVWVWDKNRPTRIIPRAEVYTSSDVTVEELRGDGDEPTLTPEALAERIGESLGSDDQLQQVLLATPRRRTARLQDAFRRSRRSRSSRPPVRSLHPRDQVRPRTGHCPLARAGTARASSGRRCRTPGARTRSESRAFRHPAGPEAARPPRRSARSPRGGAPRFSPVVRRDCSWIDCRRLTPP